MISIPLSKLTGYAHSEEKSEIETSWSADKHSHKSYTRCLAILPNGVLASGSNRKDENDIGSIYLWEMNSGKLLTSLDKEIDA